MFKAAMIAISIFAVLAAIVISSLAAYIYFNVIERRDMPTMVEGCADLSVEELQQIIVSVLRPERSPGYLGVDFYRKPPWFSPQDRAFHGRDYWSYEFDVLLAGQENRVMYAIMTCGSKVEFSILQP